MPALDTNVLVRYLVADDRRQFALARDYIESTSGDSSLFVPVSVAVELEWVLRTRYEFGREQIIKTFVALLEVREISFHDEQSIEFALRLFTEHNADFADCLHAAISIAYGRLPLVTFDRRATRVPGVDLLRPDGVEDAQ